MKIHLILSLLITLGFTAFSQNNTFPSSGGVGIGTQNPQAWFPGKVFQFKDSRPIFRLSPESEGGLGTILFKGAYSDVPGTSDEFHLNYVSSLTSPRIILGSYLGGSKLVLAILGNGNVGIGTEVPNEKLSVNGKIRAHEIKVEVSNWPDYVFAKGYLLPSLKTTAQHIKDTGHLPGLPSAAEVKATGVDLGTMNAKLLQKIEEIMIHLIRQQEEIKDLKQQIRMKR